MMDIATPYELTGRTHQKARTRAAMVAAAREFLAEGVTPTVEQAAQRAGVSRTTAYRYFANQRALLIASYPELAVASLLDSDAPADPVERLDIVTEKIARQVLEHEPELRAMLRLSLEPDVTAERLPLRQGRAVGWIEDALSPLGRHVPAPDVRRLALAIRATIGIEPLVWLTDVGGLSREQACDVMRSSARAVLQAKLTKATPDGAST